MMGCLGLLWLPIYYMESRQNASPSIETLKSNSTEDDTCGKKAREKPRKATKIVRATSTAKKLKCIRLCQLMKAIVQFKDRTLSRQSSKAVIFNYYVSNT